MNIVVCVKEIFDPEATADYYTIDNVNDSLVASKKIQKVLNPFDEHAVEAALRIKDELGANVTAICLGKDLDRVVTKKPVFMGADELVLLEDMIFDDGDTASFFLSNKLFENVTPVPTGLSYHKSGLARAF